MTDAPRETPKPPNPALMEAFWATAKAALPKVQFAATYGTRMIGTNRDTNKIINSLVANREKVGTFPLPWYFEKTKQPLPKPGDFIMLVDFDGAPQALVRTSRLESRTWATITEDDIAIDGPTMRTMSAWKKVHFEHWTRQLTGTGRSIVDDMPVLVERFDLVYATEAPYYLPAGPAQPDPAKIAAFHRASGHVGDVHVRWIGLDQPTTDQIIDLIKARDKTGTFTLPWIIARTDNRTPKAGDALILVDYTGAPALAVNLKRVYETKFDAITAADTAVDGTPVRDLAVWKPMHTQYWTALLKPFGLKVTGDMPVLIEQFELIHAR